MKLLCKHLSFFLLLSALLFAAILLSHSCLSGSDTSSADEVFEAYTDDLFRTCITESTLNLHYTLADPETFGIPRVPATFARDSEYSSLSSATVLENALERLSDFDPDALSSSNRLTWKILDAQLPRELALSSFSFYGEPCSPLLGVQAQLPVLLAEYAFYCRKDIDDYLALLNQLDAYYRALLTYQEQKAEAGLFMSSDTASRVMEGCRSFLQNQDQHFLLTSFSERLAEADFLSDQERASLEKANRDALTDHVFPAYELLLQGFSRLRDSGRNEGGLFHFPEGRAYYQALVDSVIGSGRSIPEIRSLIEDQLLSDARLMADLTARRPELITDLSGELDPGSARTPEQILEHLQSACSGDFPALADELTYTVKTVVPSLQKQLSPAFYLTPPLDRMESHVIYINPAAGCQGLSLFTTLAHEGFPGHLYQTVFEASCQPDPVRSLFYFGGYVEGWAAYAERFSYGYAKLDPDLAELLGAHSFFLLGLYARSDIGVHWDGWSQEELNRFWEGYGIRNTAALTEIWQAIRQDPANYLKYYAGALEILKLRQEAETALGGRFSLKDFHSFLLRTGPAPFSVIRSCLPFRTALD